MATSGSSKYDLLDQLAEEFAERYRRGERPSLQEYIARYPQLAEGIRDLFPALVKVEQAEQDRREPVEPPAAGTTLPLRQVGDYRILREIGHGGMGVVYEAEQISLGRHVALKVLPAHTLLDGKRLHRFRREAQAAARLHHSNIVPVFGVGEQDGLHYYVMQFIQGLPLDEVLAELQRLRRLKALPLTEEARASAHKPSARDSDVSVEAVAQALLTRPYGPSPPAALPAEERGEAALPSPPRGEGSGVRGDSAPIHLPGQSAHSTLSESGREYWHSVARVGIQVAEALAYATSQGILHRDIKPSNLLLDTQGTVWITDFGLAKVTDSDNLTDTGDLVGTFRYMAPERYQGQADVRSDVYSLGLTLYELLTLQPAFPAADRNQLMDQVRHEEPPRPRKLNSEVPRDLETIVQKAMAKEPAHRYQTATELAADLKRFVEDRPIQARRVSPAERLGRWCRRNPLVASLLAAVAFLLLAGTIISSLFALEALAQKGIAEAKAEAETRARGEKEEALEAARGMLANSQNARAFHAFEKNNLPLAHRLLDECPERFRHWDWRFLKRQSMGGLFTFRGHTAEIHYLAYSPDGKYLASACLDGTIKLWDAHAGQEVATFTGHTERVLHIAFSPDGRQLASASNDRTVKVWDSQSGQVLRTLEGHTGGVGSVEFSPDGQRLASAGEDGIVRIWDAQSGREVLTLRDHPQLRIGNATFSPDGKRLAACGDRGKSLAEPMEVCVWDARSGQKLQSFPGFRGRMYMVAFSPDGKQLAGSGGLGGELGEVKVWDPDTGREILSLRELPAPTWSVFFSPDGLRLAAAGGGFPPGRPSPDPVVIKVWDLRSRQEVFTFKGHTKVVAGMTFSPNGRRLATVSHDGDMMIWDLDNGQESRSFKDLVGDPRSVVFSADGRHLAAGNGTTVKLWDRATGQEIRTLQGHAVPVNSVVYSLDGKLLATAGGKRGGPGELKVWDAATGQETFSLQWPTVNVQCVAFNPDGTRLAAGGLNYATEGRIPRPQPWEIHVWDMTTRKGILRLTPNYEVYSVVFSPDGTWLASGGGAYGEPGQVEVWDVQSGQQVRSLKGNRYGVVSLAFSPDGTRLASASGRTAQPTADVKVWEVPSGRPIQSLEGHAGGVTGVAFSPDGSRLASRSDDGTAKVWDLKNCQEVLTLKVGGKGGEIAFSPDGQFLASGACRVDPQTQQTRGEIKLWDAREVLAVPSLKGHVGVVSTVTFSPDGMWLASGGRDQTVRIWDAVRGEELRTLEGHTGAVNCLAFSPDGQRLASSSRGTDVGQPQEIKVWDLHTGQAVLSRPGSARPVTSLAFDPDSRFLAWCTGNPVTPGEVRLWDTRDGRELPALDGYSHVALTPSGKHLIALAQGGQKKPLDLLTRQEVTDPDIFFLTVRQPKPSAVSPDKQRLAQVAEDTIRLFDLSLSAEERAYRLALAQPDPGWHLRQAADAEQTGTWFAVAFHLDHALQLQPSNDALYPRRARARAELQRWPQAAADFARVVEKTADQVHAWRRLALSQLAAGQTEAYQQTCAQMRQRFGRADVAAPVALLLGGAVRPGVGTVFPAALVCQTAQQRNVTARTCVLRSDAVAAPAELPALAEETDPTTRGAALCRAGRHDEAVQVLRPLGSPVARLYLALAEQARGRASEARRALEEARESLRAAGDGLGSWEERLETDLRRREVEALLNETGPSSKRGNE